jgi:hypothetical protein
VAERGAWFMVGVPWATAMAVARAPAEGWLLLPPLALAILARGPVMWSIWALRRRPPVTATWRRRLWFGLAACGGFLVWARRGVGAAAVASAAVAAGWSAVEVLARILWSRPVPQCGLGGALGGGAVALAVLSAAGAAPPVAWALGGCLAYASGVSTLGMHLVLQRVPRAAPTGPAASPAPRISAAWDGARRPGW